ncbi:hypothetical protein Bbelb_067860 [Branchiostoma belcheri]|nr:hypothetical protein Bbelb_067860 [Branchiostoma belcheri]
MHTCLHRPTPPQSAGTPLSRHRLFSDTCAGGKLREFIAAMSGWPSGLRRFVQVAVWFSRQTSTEVSSTLQAEVDEGRSICLEIRVENVTILVSVAQSVSAFGC